MPLLRVVTMWRCCVARGSRQNSAGLSGATVEAPRHGSSHVDRAKVRVGGSAGHSHGLVFGGTASRTRSVVYLSSLIRSVIALHNLINNKLSNKEAERAVADDSDKDKHKVRSDATGNFGPTCNLHHFEIVVADGRAQQGWMRSNCVAALAADSSLRSLPTECGREIRGPVRRRRRRRKVRRTRIPRRARRKEPRSPKKS